MNYRRTALLGCMVALAVAAIPEGLPIVATIALAKGMMRLSKRQVIIKKLEAIQTLGATNIICTDKTGTLTEDKMKVHAIYLADTDLYDIQQKNKDDFDALKGQEAFYKIALASILCNNVSPFDEGIQGDSIEVALIEFAIKAGCDINLIRKNNPKKLEMPFDADRKLMATVHQNKQGFYAYVKGAFETLVAECDSILEDGKISRFTNKEKWYEKVDSLASQGLRTLAFGYKEVDKIPEDKDLTK